MSAEIYRKNDNLLTERQVNDDVVNAEELSDVALVVGEVRDGGTL